MNLSFLSEVERIEGLTKIVREKKKIVLWNYTCWEDSGEAYGHSCNDVEAVKVTRQISLPVHTYSLLERLSARRELKRIYRTETVPELKWIAGNGAGYSSERMKFYKNLREHPVKAITKEAVPWIGAAIYVSAVMGTLYLIARGLGLE